MPKSGSTWLRSILSELPCCSIRLLTDRKGVLRNHDLCEHFLISKNDRNFGYEIIRLHTRWSIKNFGIIKDKYVKTVLIWRDLRDVAVSRFYWVKTLPKNPLFQYYNACSLEEGIAHSIEYTIEWYVPWLQNWRNVALRHPGMFLPVTYESLLEDTQNMVHDICKFYGITLRPDDIRCAVDKFQRRDAKKGIETYRKGIIGDWKNHFNKKHIVTFKRKAGKLLIELGYESDFSW